MTGEIVTHFPRVIGVHRDVIQLTVLLWRIGKQLNVLLVVDFHECNSN